MTTDRKLLLVFAVFGLWAAAEMVAAIVTQIG